MVVGFGVVFDVLVAALIFGLFFLQIRSTFDSLEVEIMHASLVEKDEA